MITLIELQDIACGEAQTLIQEANLWCMEKMH
jgi:hypothetical protein